MGWAEGGYLEALCRSTLAAGLEGVDRIEAAVAQEQRAHRLWRRLCVRASEAYSPNLAQSHLALAVRLMKSRTRAVLEPAGQAGPTQPGADRVVPAIHQGRHPSAHCWGPIEALGTAQSQLGQVLRPRRTGATSRRRQMAVARYGGGADTLAREEPETERVGWRRWTGRGSSCRMTPHPAPAPRAFRRRSTRWRGGGLEPRPLRRNDPTASRPQPGPPRAP